MDIKTKRKLIPAIGFVLVCGVVCLKLQYGCRESEQIVLEKRAEAVSASELPAAESSSDVLKVPDDLEQETEKIIVVHICGAIVSEGVYSLPAGSRLADGIAAAGGFGEDADTTFHNLAAYLSDGQKVYVPTLGETGELPVTERLERNDENKGSLTPGTANDKINLNTAGLEELMKLNGIGEAKAESILQYREKVGSFQCIEDLKNVSGIGDAMYERIKECIVAE